MNVANTMAGAIPSTPEEHQVVKPGEGRASAFEQFLAAAWFLATTTTFDYYSPVRYVLVAVFLVMMVRNHHKFSGYLLHHWFFFLFPLWATLSFFWSSQPPLAFRFGILQSIDLLIMMYIASQFAPIQILRSLFWGFMAVGVHMLLAFPEMMASGRGYPLLGFGEKNSFAARMVILMTVCTFMLLSHKARLIEKVVAVVMFMPAAFALLQANSATALVLGIFAIGSLLITGPVLPAIRSVAGLGPFLMALLVCIFGVLAISFMNDASSTSLWSVFLESVGKDATLTGRTELWAEARNQIEQRPIFGTGAAGYWTPWNGSAQTMLELFYKEQFMAFSFHSSYFEVAVNLGFVGLAAFLVSLIFVVYRLFANWFRFQNLETTFFAIVGMLALVRSFTEVELYQVFHINKQMLFLGGLIYMHRVAKAIPQSNPLSSAPPLYTQQVRS